MADVRGSAVEAVLFSVFKLEPELRRDDGLLADWGERFADEFLVRERPVRFGRVDERDPLVNGRTDNPHAPVAARRGPIAAADPHTAQPARRALESARS